MISRRNFLTFAASTFIANAIPAHATSIFDTPPPSVDWYTTVDDKWGLFLNDILGDCVEASCANAVLQWSTINKYKVKVENRFVEDLYSKTTGYIHGKPKTDKGSETPNVLSYWKDSGWNIGETNFLQNYSILDGKNIDVVKNSIYKFGGVIYDFTCPEEYFDDERYGYQLKKHIRHPNKKIDHSIYIAGYNKDELTFVSHGEAGKMSWDFFLKFQDGVYAMLNPLWIKHGVSPAGHKYEYLQEEIKRVDKNYAWQEISNPYWNMK